MASIVDIIVNASDKASGTLKTVSGGFKNLESSAQKASGVIMGGLGLMATALGAVAYAGVKHNAVMETSKAKWTTLTGSIEGAKKQMAFVQKYAEDSPFDFEGVDQTATSLMGMGMELETVNKWIPTLGDMASVLGGGTETIKGVGVALGQMNAKGKVSAEEMGQLAERGVNAWQMLADGTGLTVAQVRKLSEEGKLLAEDALPMIQAGMAETFGGGTAQFMDSTIGQAQQAQEAFTQLSGSITAGAYAWFGSTVLPMINTALEKLRTIFSGGIIQGFENLWNSSTKAKIALMAMASVIIAMLIGAMFLIVPAVASAVIAFAPFLAIGALVAGIAYLIMTNWSKFAPFFSSTFEAVKKYVSGFKQAFLTSFQSLMASMGPLWSALKELFNTIKPVLIAVGALVGVVLGVVLTVALAVFNGVVRAIGPLITAFVKFGTMVANVVKAVVKYLSGDMKGASEAWKKATQNAVDVVKNLWNAFKGFFSGFIGTIVAIFSKFGIDLKTKAKDAWTKVVSAFKEGVNGAKVVLEAGLQIAVRAIIKFGVTFLKAGKGLLEAFTKGIASGIGKAVKAVSSGMKKIRDFLPFSPAKKGPLSDLDKSGKSFFPTWYEGALKKVPAMGRAVGGAMSQLNSEMMKNNGSVELEAFTGGRSRMTVIHSHEHSGQVQIKGDGGNKEAFKMTGENVKTTTENDVMKGLRQAVRKN